MNSGKYVFTQFLQFVNRYGFEKCVKSYNGDCRAHNFNCWNQFIQLFFGQLTSKNSLRDIATYLREHRPLEYHDLENDADLIFLTNNMEVSALEVAKLYQNRWHIETFFKWIKQNLTMKKLWGHSENAVNIHIWVAICTYLVVGPCQTFPEKRTIHVRDNPDFGNIIHG